MTAGHDIVAIIGASNALGCGAGLFSYRDPASPHIIEICEPTEGEIVAQPITNDPITRSYETKPMRDDYNVGPTISFARRYAAHTLKPGRKVAFVNGRVLGGGADDELYLKVTRRLEWALTNLPGDNAIVALLIQNGEREIIAVESGRRPVESLCDAEVGLIGRFRSDFGADIPASIGEPPQEWTGANPVRASSVGQMREAASRLHKVVFVSSDGLPSNPLDSKHFCAQSAVEMGARHYDAIAALVDGNDALALSNRRA